MRVLINAVSAKMGGTANYIKEIAVQLAKLRRDDDFVFMVPPEQVAAVQALAPEAQVISCAASHASRVKRIWFDQFGLRRILRKHRIDVLFSTTNFALFATKRRQLVLMHNSIYFSHLYEERFLPGTRLTTRLGHHLKSWLARRSVRPANVVMTPSQTILDEIQTWAPVSSGKGLVNPYGVSPERFPRVTPSASAATGRKSFTMVFTSLYADHKNVGTLLRGTKQLVDRGLNVRLVTTADPNWHMAQLYTQNWKADQALASDPALKDRVEFVLRNPNVPASQLYRAGDVFVYPSVVESFGHPLLEAMSSGLPIVAADVPINRELCGDAALYFNPFQPQDFASCVEKLMSDPALRNELAEKGYQRSQSFRWERHAVTLLACLQQLAQATAAAQIKNPVEAQ